MDELAMSVVLSGQMVANAALLVADRPQATHVVWRPYAGVGPGRSGRNRVRCEATSLLNPFFALSLSLAFPLARQAVAPLSPSSP